ncbi:cation efflux protein [Conidiobolus coronatus NRRL 28638]|uniref:Cation efflux protein n=1 Tax=Conidiobolus coronatus (strain ATCC 28846 / CBS 209.66 / NRRL 28638) TaxID=796925 RepID=A0A137PE88_CONC2|nr:cation efflux protein [Conidiobolus coronatus NRRL 28638]|eukprot:KXN73282.1 cation efflux protein [Conidiobolus coronatus NRRL 28638]
MFKLSKSTKLAIQLGLSLTLMIAELVIGYLVNSIALIADSFHMLNDVISLAIALYAVKLSNKKDYDPRYTYGYQRAEILGGLVNGVLLLGVSFTIFIEAIQRFFTPIEIEHPQLILIVGSLGLFVNVFGMFLFGGHDHCHSHSHGHDHSHNRNDDDIEAGIDNKHIDINEKDVIQSSNNDSNTNFQAKKIVSTNMHAVYLHVLGDALTSIGVIIVSLIIWLADFKEKYLFDPIISILITLLIVKLTVPLIKRTSQILLQSSPVHVPITKINEELEKIPEILGAHELHIWQLSDDKIVASAHISIQKGADYMEICSKVKCVLNKFGVNEVTIQPEEFYLYLY